MNRFTKLLGITLLTLGLTGCSDTTAPTAVVSDYSIERNFIISEDKLIERMVTDIEDNNKITIKQPVDITNFTDIDFTKVGDYKLYFTVVDDAGNKTDYQSTLTITPTEKEQSAAAYESTVAQYKAEVTDLKKLKLADQDQLDKMIKSIDRLTTTDYLHYRENIDQVEKDLYSHYVNENDVLLETTTELVAKSLELKDDDLQILSYQEELEDIDITVDDLQEQNKIYSRLTKVKDSLNTRYRELEIEVSGIPEELYDNQFLQVTTCNYNINRNPNVKVDIGAGNREYYAFTNEDGQLAFITADQITIQNESTEAVNDRGQYCDQPADVISDSEDTKPKTIIADSLGGASNSYNVIPAGNSYSKLESIEKEILTNGGATNFQATLTYSSSSSRTPSTIEVSYTLGSKPVEYTIYN